MYAPIAYPTNTNSSGSVTVRDALATNAMAAAIPVPASRNLPTKMAVDGAPRVVGTFTVAAGRVRTRSGIHIAHRTPDRRRLRYATYAIDRMVSSSTGAGSSSSKPKESMPVRPWWPGRTRVATSRLLATMTSRSPNRASDSGSTSMGICRSPARRARARATARWATQAAPAASDSLAKPWNPNALSVIQPTVRSRSMRSSVTDGGGSAMSVDRIWVFMRVLLRVCVEMTDARPLHARRTGDAVRDFRHHDETAIRNRLLAARADAVAPGPDAGKRSDDRVVSGIGAGLETAEDSGSARRARLHVGGERP